MKVEEEEYTSLSDEDEAVASDLDMHSLILGRSHESEPEPPTADEVIKEIDFIMQVRRNFFFILHFISGTAHYTFKMIKQWFSIPFGNNVERKEFPVINT